MKKLKFLVVVLLLIISAKSESQVKCLWDTEYKKFCIGFQIFVPSNDRTKILICNEDKTIEHLLFDSTLEKNDSLYFIFEGMSEKERSNYWGLKLYSIPLFKSGIYYIEYSIRQKFVLVK
jgi:hypothetical protein